jgi:hypothetical protein
MEDEGREKVLQLAVLSGRSVAEHAESGVMTDCTTKPIVIVGEAISPKNHHRYSDLIKIFVV